MACLNFSEEKLTAQERQFAGHEIRMTEMDLRFQMVETASYDGKLLWKIRDFTQRKRVSEIFGLYLSLNSPFSVSFVLCC